MQHTSNSPTKRYTFSADDRVRAAQKSSRTRVLSPERRKAIARQAAEARWALSKASADRLLTGVATGSRMNSGAAEQSIGLYKKCGKGTSRALSLLSKSQSHKVSKEFSLDTLPAFLESDALLSAYTFTARQAREFDARVAQASGRPLRTEDELLAWRFDLACRSVIKEICMATRDHGHATIHTQDGYKRCAMASQRRRSSRDLRPRCVAIDER